MSKTTNTESHKELVRSTLNKEPRIESKKIYCRRAFDHAQLLDNGEVSPCCPPWVNHYSLGNINEQSYEEIWNGEKAQKFRESILDGSYKYCNAKSCPHLGPKTHCVGTIEDHIRGRVHEDIMNDMLDEKTVISHGPHEIQFCNDRSCNLSCPSCRRGVIMVSGKEKQKLLDMQTKFQADFLKDADRFTITGSGDAFASPIFRKFLQTFTKEQAPKLRHINVLTNGLLLKKHWHTLSDYSKEKIEYISVSIDASTPETYAINRRGGDWDLLHENLKFIQRLKLDKKILEFQASFVVQDNNFHEIKDFVLMCESYGVTHIQLQIIEPDFIRDLGYGDYLEEWIQKAVHEKSHPNHNELLSIIRDDFFVKYIDRIDIHKPEVTIAMGPLLNLREGRDISQYDELLTEEAAEKKGSLKDIWYNNKVYFVALDTIKEINGADAAKLSTGETVVWNKDEEKWIEYYARR
jgi:radical SAM protein with 4Fe4S-binding SPASM domain